MPGSEFYCFRSPKGKSSKSQIDAGGDLFEPAQLSLPMYKLWRVAFFVPPVGLVALGPVYLCKRALSFTLVRFSYSSTP